jgi:hypothetical protein
VAGSILPDAMHVNGFSESMTTGRAGTSLGRVEAHLYVGARVVVRHGLVTSEQTARDGRSCQPLLRWLEHGSDTLHEDWYEYAFGDLSETAKTRHSVLKTLLPQLRIADLFGLSFTPLVLGQDNGDGTNSYVMCLFFAISSSVAYSVIVVPVILLNAFLLSPLLRLTRIKS